MTSKELLNKVIALTDYTSKDYQKLVKDLEVLEIIKRWSFIQDNYKEGYGTFTQFLCNIHTIGMREDFKKIKEWLEK